MIGKTPHLNLTQEIHAPGKSSGLLPEASGQKVQSANLLTVHPFAIQPYFYPGQIIGTSMSIFWDLTPCSTSSFQSCL